MSPSSGPTDLQFDRAEFASEAAAIPTCGLCQRPVQRTYFDVNGKMTCSDCRDAIVREQASSAGARGIIVAIVAGIGAGIVGALLYYAVLAITGYELGLIAVVVGFFVGAAVRWGSGGRGGRVYQAIAVTITYVAIVSTYVPFIFAAASQPRETLISPSSSATAGATKDTSATPAPKVDASEAPPTAGQIAVWIMLLIALILASPFLAGFGNIIGWVIIGVAMYEAWKANRRAEFQIAGPFAIAPSATTPATAEPNAS
jgi:hypothetical protein